MLSCTGVEIGDVVLSSPFFRSWGAIAYIQAEGTLTVRVPDVVDPAHRRRIYHRLNMRARANGTTPSMDIDAAAKYDDANQCGLVACT